MKARPDKYKVDKNINAGYTHWVYFKTLSAAKKYVKSNPNYPMVRQYIYKIKR